MNSAIVCRLKSFDVTAILQRMGQVRAPWLWIALIVFLFVVPAIVLRGAHYEEGSIIGMARGAFEDGHWLVPYLYGIRFAERPVLLSWLLGAVGLITGNIPIWLARLPVAAALLGGGWLVYYVVRKHASAAAGLVGALCFLACPSVLQKVVTAETDIIVASTLFAAFVVHWNGEERGGGSALRWIAVGLILCAAGLVKGPQPLGYFFCGFGAFYLLQRRWLDLIKLGLLGLIPAVVIAAWYVSVYQSGDELNWARHSRLEVLSPLAWGYGTIRFIFTIALLWLPGWLLLVPVTKETILKPVSEADKLMAALLSYAAVCTIALAFWPHANGRYAIPAILAVAAAAGLSFERVRETKPVLTRIAGAILVMLVVYRVALNWLVMPLAPDLFGSSRYYGQFVAEAVATRPATIYVSMGNVNHNLFIYVPNPMREVPLAAIAAMPPPVWAVVRPDEEQLLRTMKPDAEMIVHIAGGLPTEWLLLDIRKRP